MQRETREAPAHRPSSTLVATLALLLGCAAGGVGCGGDDSPAPRLGAWPAYGGSLGGTRHSAANEITPENVGDLEVAWTYHTGDVSDGSTTLAPTSFQDTPILHDGTLYLCTPFNRVIALDATTGEERWSYDPEVDTSAIYVTACRGVSYWEDELASEGSACRKRIVLGTLDARLIALDATSGEPCRGFGKNGTVDLAQGIGDRSPGEYGVTSPPAIVNGVIVTGAMVLDNRRVDAPGGVVRGFDARSGALRWAWDPIPPGAPKERGRYTRGTTNVWSVLSADPALGLVYAPTGNTSPDYYGGHRDGLDYYSSSVVALDAATGKVRWHFQTVHHDIWDYDLPAQPVLFDFPSAAGPVPAVAQLTKMGHVFVLDRRTGEPLLPIEERAVPQGAVAGEYLSPTQPFPLYPSEPLHPNGPLTGDDAFGFTFYDRGRCRELIENARSEGIFTPPAIEGTIHSPGMMGGSNWGSASVDHARGVLVLNMSLVPTYVRLIPRAEMTPDMLGAKYGFEPAEGTPYGVQRFPLLSPFGAPCTKPPWGIIAALDLATGETRWKRSLGTTRDMAPWPLWFDTGTPNQGGPITTSTGLTFIGATSDQYLRAFDTDSGEELWRGRLPAAGQATPMSYRLSPEGKQYVVIAAGGHGIMGTKVGDSVVAFTLPD